MSISYKTRIMLFQICYRRWNCNSSSSSSSFNSLRTVLVTDVWEQT